MKIFFSVGEPSGDLHGANLVRTLRQQHDAVQCVGFGGPRMAAAGMELHADLTELAVMWLLHALMNLPKFWRLLWRADAYFRDARPDAVVLIDYPGFNWWIARRARAHGIPVFYYGVPQMWAWASWRIHKMRRLVDHVLCKLPFEADWYRERGCVAEYVGHPYFDEMTRQQLDTDFLARMRSDLRPIVTLLPGSRRQEVAHNLPCFLKVVARLAVERPDVRFLIAAFNAEQAAMANALVTAQQLPVSIHVHRTPELISLADACLACSGSVSLELLYHLKPTVIHYRISRLAFAIQSYFRRVRFITLVNLLISPDRYCSHGELYDASRDNVPYPEFLTCTDRSVDISNQLLKWLNDPQARSQVVAQLLELKRTFAIPGASERAATLILHKLRERPDHSMQQVTSEPRRAA